MSAAAAAAVPDDLKKEIRSILLSKIGGVCLSDFCSDFRKLVGHRLDYRCLGITSVRQLMEAIPDVARIAVSPKDNQEHVFGLKDPGMFMNCTALKAQYKPGRDGRTTTAATTLNLSCSDAQKATWLQELKPNGCGLYAICFPTLHQTDQRELEQMLGEYGKVAEINILTRYTFARYASRDCALKALAGLHVSLKAAVPRERMTSSRPAVTNASGERSSAGGQRVDSSSVDVFIGNLSADVDEAALDELLKEYNCLEIRLRSKEDKLFAFASVSDEAEAERVTRGLNNTGFRGNTLRVRVSEKSRQESGSQALHAFTYGCTPRPAAADHRSPGSDRSAAGGDGGSLNGGGGGGGGSPGERSRKERRNPADGSVHRSPPERAVGGAADGAASDNAVRAVLFDDYDDLPPLDELSDEDLADRQSPVGEEVSSVVSSDAPRETRLSDQLAAVELCEQTDNTYVDVKAQPAQLYVTSLPEYTKQADLLATFQPYGAIGVTPKINALTGRRFAFVNFPSEQCAAAVLAVASTLRLYGAPLDIRSAFLNIQQPAGQDAPPGNGVSLAAPLRCTVNFSPRGEAGERTVVVNKPVSRAPRPPQTYGSRPGPPHQYAPEPHGPRPGPYNQGPPRPGPPRPGPPHQYAPQQFRPRQAPPRQCAPNQFAPRGQYAPLSQYGPWPSAPRSNGPSAGRPRTGAGPQVDRAPSGTPCFQTGAAGAGAGTGVERRGMLSAGALDRMLADCCPQTQLLSAADLPQCVSVLVCHLEQEGEGEGEAGGEGRGMAILWGQLCCSHFVDELQWLKTIAESMADVSLHLPYKSTQQRCAAMYDGEWYRCWRVGVAPDGRTATVYFIDYGNTERVAVGELRGLQESAWQLRPVAVPFRVHPGELDVGLTDVVGHVVSAQVTGSRYDPGQHVIDLKILKVM